MSGEAFLQVLKANGFQIIPISNWILLFEYLLAKPSKGIGSRIIEICDKKKKHNDTNQEMCLPQGTISFEGSPGSPAPKTVQLQLSIPKIWLGLLFGQTTPSKF